MIDGSRASRDAGQGHEGELNEARQYSLPPDPESITPMHARTWFVLPPTLLLPGCCGIFAVLCGPDRSAWVSESYVTPEAAIATFQEATRRADSLGIYRTLSVDFLERQGIPDAVAVTVAWEHLEERVPGLHALGSATVSKPEIERDGRRTFTLSVAGHSLKIRVAKEEFWRVRGERQGQPFERSRAVRSLQEFVTVEGTGAPSKIAVTLSQRELAKKRFPDLRADEITEVTVAREWKIDEILAPVTGGRGDREPNAAGG